MLVLSRMMQERTFLFDFAAGGGCFFRVEAATEGLSKVLWFSEVVIDAFLVLLYATGLDLVVLVEGEAFGLRERLS